MLQNKILKTLFIISIILLIITLNFKLLALNFNFYQKEFFKLNVYEKIPDADKNALNLINYLNGKEQLNNFYNEKEKMHLQDVKDLLNKLSLLFYISLIFSLSFLIYFIYKREYKLIFNSFFIASLSVIIIIFISLLIFVNFDKFFIKFHEIFFSNDLWLLNPEKDNLINMFPLQFFYDITRKIFVNIFIVSSILIIFAKLKISKKLLNKYNNAR
jgi:integral membrane protein (TIGR01906 family)